MRYARIVVPAVGLVIAAAAAGQTTRPAREETVLEGQAQGFVMLLAKKEFSKAVEGFDATMQGALPAEKLKGVWEGVVKGWGELRKIEGARTEVVAQYRVVYVTCAFEKSRGDVKVVFDGARKVSGLFFAAAPEYKTPAYVDLKTFEERDCVVGAGTEWELPGKLCMPVGVRGGKAVPAVVLVAGSGPQDWDETIGPNKPFRDIAWGLATRGIAVLRYEKRTKRYAPKVEEMIDTFTVNQETVEDAVVAVHTLRNTPGIDAKRVFVLGHSLGGMMVPRIAEKTSDGAGFVVMASPARPLEEMVVEQMEFQASLKKPLSAEDRAKLVEIRRQAAAIKALKPGGPREMLLGGPASYWLDLRGYDAVAEAGKISKRLLVLQGEKDCQVSAGVDFAKWKEALGAKKNVTLKEFAKLNHLLMPVEGKSTGEEYAVAGNVDQEMVEAVAKWVAAE